MTNTNCENKPVEECIRVAVRMRPLNEREVAFSRAWHHLKNQASITQISNTGKPLDPLPGRTLFTFDKIFDETNTTAQVYQWAAKSVVHSVVGGRNGSIFTYGQTNSGKTYTMQGKGSIRSGVRNGGGGIMHMAAEDLFRDMAAVTDRDFVIRVSVIEIYKEEVRDLLLSSNTTTTSTTQKSERSLVVREDPRRGIFVSARKYEVKDVRKLLAVLSAGEKNRSVGSTNLNQRSSRSHLICTVYVESKPKQETTQQQQRRKRGVRSATINFVDLAGSEGVRHRNPKHRQNSASERRREGSSINKSLLTLSRVISAIGSSKQPHISFRDSKLTRVLQPALTGNARLSFICCATSSDVFLEDTRSTLQFGSRIKHITTKTNVNILDDNSVYQQIKEELAKTKEIIARWKDKCHKLENENAELKSRVEMLSIDNRRVLLSLRQTRSEGHILSGDSEAPKRIPKIVENKAETTISLEKAHQDLEEQVDILATVVDTLKSKQTAPSRNLQAGITRKTSSEGRAFPSNLKWNGLPNEIAVDDASFMISEPTMSTVLENMIKETDSGDSGISFEKPIFQLH